MGSRVMEEVLVDTTFLIDLQKSMRKRRNQQVENWLSENMNTVLLIPSIVLGEFASGFENNNSNEVTGLYRNHKVLSIGVKEALTYSQLYRDLKRDGNLIGANDLWIAACALANKHPLLTRNWAHFERVEGLQLLRY